MCVRKALFHTMIRRLLHRIYNDSFIFIQSIEEVNSIHTMQRIALVTSFSNVFLLDCIKY